jgi:integrase/recombinase XerD
MTTLRQRMLEDMQARSLSPQTQATYVQQVSLFARHFNRSPELLGPEEIRSYQVYLTNERKLAPSSISIAISALRFLYRITLHKDWSLTEVIPTPKKPQKLPIVPSPEEVLQFLGCVWNIKHRTILTICYAAGLRVSEAVCLKVRDIDSKRNGYSSRTRQRAHRPLCDAFSKVAPNPARLVASGQTAAVALPGR